jgi:hypothetical protein
MYVVLALLMLMGKVQKPTQRTGYCLLLFFSETLPLERLEVIMKCMHFSDSSKQNEYQGPPKLFKLYPAIQHLNNKFQHKTSWKKNGSGVPHPAHSRPPIEPLPKRLLEQHFLERIPATGKKTRPKRMCVVCTKHRKRIEDIHWCSECEAGMSLDGFFKS